MRIMNGKQRATANTEATWHRQQSNPSIEAGIRESPFVKKMRSQSAEEARMRCGTQRIATMHVQEESHTISSVGSPAQLQVSEVLPSIIPTPKTKLLARHLTSSTDAEMVQATMATGRLRLRLAILAGSLMFPRSSETPLPHNFQHFHNFFCGICLSAFNARCDTIHIYIMTRAT